MGDLRGESKFGKRNFEIVSDRFEFNPFIVESLQKLTNQSKSMKPLISDFKTHTIRAIGSSRAQDVKTIS